MTVASECKNHGGVEANFTCSACGDAFCKDCMGRTDQGQSICLSCSIEQSAKKASSESLDDRLQRRERAESVEAQRVKAMDSRKWLVILLVIAIPVVGFELFLLNSSGPAEVTVEDVARVEVGSSLVVITALNNYRGEEGKYPASLDQLAPRFWAPDRVGLLERFDYRRITPESFELRNREASRTPGAEKIRNILPSTVKAGDDIGEFLAELRP